MIKWACSFCFLFFLFLSFSLQQEVNLEDSPLNENQKVEEKANKLVFKESDEEEGPSHAARLLSATQENLKNELDGEYDLQTSVNRKLGRGLNFAFVQGKNRNGGRVSVLEGKGLEWNLRKADEDELPSKEEEEELPPNLVGYLLRSKQKMDRITTIHERQMSRLLHELIMEGMITHSKLVRFANRFEFSQSNRDRRLAKALLQIVGNRRVARKIHERHLMQINHARRIETLMWNRLILKQIQTLGIHELGVELGRRKWGKEYLRQQVIQDLLHHSKMDNLVKIQNLFRNIHTFKLANKFRKQQQSFALQGLAKVFGLRLPSTLPMIKPGGGLVLTLNKNKSKKSDSFEAEDSSDSNDVEEDLYGGENYEEFDDAEEEEAPRRSKRSRGNFNRRRRSNRLPHPDIDPDDLAQVERFLEDAENDQITLLKKHRRYLRDLKTQLREDREKELAALEQAGDEILSSGPSKRAYSRLIDTLFSYSDLETERYHEEIRTYHRMIDELRDVLQDETNRITDIDLELCDLEDAICDKKTCSKHNGFGSYLAEFLSKLIKLRLKQKKQSQKIKETLGDYEQEIQDIRGKGKNDDDEEEEEKESKGKKKEEDDDDDEEKEEKEEKQTAFYEEEEEGEEKEAEEGEEKEEKEAEEGEEKEKEEKEGEEEHKAEHGEEEEEEEKEKFRLVSLSQLVRLIRGLVYFTVDQDKRERNLMDAIVNKHERVHHKLLNLIQRYQVLWEKDFYSGRDGRSDKEKLKDGARDIAKLLKATKIFARRTKQDEIAIIRVVLLRRRKVSLLIQKVVQAFNWWRKSQALITAKVSSLLVDVIKKQQKQHSEEVQILGILDKHRKGQESDEVAILKELSKWRQSVYDERSQKRGFRLLIFKNVVSPKKSKRSGRFD